MPTRKRFWEDPYLTHLDTTVLAVDGQRVHIRETIFFASSGGQESDAGTLGGYPVLHADKEGLDLVYTLPPDHQLRAGDGVAIWIDGARRLGLMRHHFAAEMILQLVYRARPGIERIGAHIAADKARIDFASDTSLSPLLPELEREAASLVARALPIHTAFSDIDAERRYWQVEGFASMPCGGTHPRTTAEVGALTLKRRNTGKGKERIEIVLAPLVGGSLNRI